MSTPRRWLPHFSLSLPHPVANTGPLTRPSPAYQSCSRPAPVRRAPPTAVGAAWSHRIHAVPAHVMTMLGEKLRRVPWTTQSGWEVNLGTLFLGSSESIQLYWVGVKGCRVRRPPARSVHQMYVDWYGKRTCRVDQVFPCRVYIDSNRRDSRIWVTACSWLLSSSNLLD
jgi:hypothetical protein